MLWWTLGYTYLFQFWFPRCVCRFLKHSLECFFKTPFRFLALPSPYEVKVNPLKAQPLNGTTTMFLSILKSFCTFNLYHVFYLKKVFLWYCPLFILSSYVSPFVHSTWFDASRKYFQLFEGFLEGHFSKAYVYL